MEINSDLFCQSGSNDNGNWIKFADGTMICYGNGSVSPSASYIIITYPETFSKTPNLQLTAKYFFYADVCMTYKSLTTSHFEAYPQRASTGEAVGKTQEFSWLAIGRWK